MDHTRQHDATVESLAAALRQHFAADDKTTVLSGVRWQPLADFPNIIYTFDVMILDGDSRPVWDAAQGFLLPEARPVTVIDVLSRDGWKEEFYDKPDTLSLAGVYEYCLWDPSATVLRPPLQAHRKHDSGFRLTRTTLHGVFLSDARFRLDVCGPEFKISSCGPAFYEEDLFTCQRLLDAALQRADREQKEIDGLTAKVHRLQAKIAGAGP